jgi:N-acetyl-anhydromuramyl-L-alanine amidase AmpD
MLPEPGYYWPPHALEDENDSIDALKRAFSELGYKDCENGDLEAGFQKVAIGCMRRFRNPAANGAASSATVTIFDTELHSVLRGHFMGLYLPS